MTIIGLREADDGVGDALQSPQQRRDEQDRSEYDDRGTP